MIVLSPFSLPIWRQKIKLLWQYLIRLCLVGILAGGIGIGCFASPAIAAESIILKFRDQRLTLPQTQLQTIVETGESPPALATFLQQTPLTAAQTRELLTQPIIPSGKINLDSQTIAFITLQLNKLIGTPLGQEPQDALQTVVANALRDDRPFSVLDLIYAYPDRQVRVELANLERVQRDVSLLVERIAPLLTLMQPLLPELLCDCNLGTRFTPSDGAPSTKSVQSVQSVVDVAAIPPAKAIAHSPTSKPELAQGTPPEFTSIALSRPARDKQITFTFGPLAQSLAIRDLETFVETGEQSSTIRFILKLAKLSPDDFKTLLTQSISADLKFLDRTLNSLLGEYALFQVGQVLHTPSRQANIQALRSTLVLAARDDNRISPLELLQTYPTQTLYIDGVRLARIARTAKRMSVGGTEQVVGSLLDEIEEWLVSLQASAAEVVCECPPVP